MDRESIHLLRRKEEGLSSFQAQPSSTAHYLLQTVPLFQHLETEEEMCSGMECIIFPFQTISETFI
jgi:hypothetical protein